MLLMSPLPMAPPLLGIPTLSILAMLLTVPLPSSALASLEAEFRFSLMTLGQPLVPTFGATLLLTPPDAASLTPMLGPSPLHVVIILPHTLVLQLFLNVVNPSAAPLLLEVAFLL